MWDFPIFPDQASTIAPHIDAVYFFVIAVSAVFGTLIFALIFIFALQYRRKGAHDLPEQVHGSMALEIGWSVIPFILVMIIFAWGAAVFFRSYTPPADAMDVHVVGKQWMWKVQHPEGPREINHLHVPVGQPVRLIITSEDVIHSFYIPAFRIKMDAVPGRYTTTWFEATKPGRYHLFCAEYCGNQHSKMGGWVEVMEPRDYQRWLTQEGGEPLSSVGERLFTQFRCDTCHRPDGSGRGPSLVGVFGSEVALRGGQTVIADEAYVRESVLNPRAKIVSSFRPVMPTFQGQLSEEQVLELVSYIKSLAEGEGSQ